MKVSEIMTKEVKFLSPRTSVLDAVARLAELHISGLPVVDEAGKIVGMFTEKDVLRSLLPSYVSQVGRFVYENSPKTIQSKVAKLQGFTVADFMRKELVKVLPEASVYEVAHIMLIQNVRRIPVVDKTDKVVGIVGRFDVLSKILKGTI